MSWLLDTCHFQVDPTKTEGLGCQLDRRTTNEDELFLSVVTVGELEKGIAKLSDSAKRAKLGNGYVVNSRIGFAAGC